MKGEIRQDITTGDWVILAPGRGERPSDFNREKPSLPRREDYDPECPFCPGNENLIPPILEDTAADKGSGWQTCRDRCRTIRDEECEGNNRREER